MNITSQYSLIKADQNVYSKCFATYRNNIWFRPSWLSIYEMMLNASDCYWVIKDNKRIAGISLTENTLGSFFILPPFTLSRDMVDFLKDVCLDISEDKSRIDAYNVLPEHINIFEKVGFSILSTRKCMIRPTEKIAISGLIDFVRVQPEMEHLSSIIHLMEATYTAGTDERDLDTYRRDITYYFEHNKEKEILEASSIIIHKRTHEIVGVCLVSLWEDMPLIYEIAVKSTYSNQGLGRHMLYKAITNLESAYPVIRLFVTSGNKAEFLYSSLGFLAGTETSHLGFKAN